MSSPELLRQGPEKLPEARRRRPSRRQLAVALRYEAGRRAAPHLVAKGEGALAESMVQIAHAHGVPVRRDGGLAGALSGLSLGQEIPEELFRAVAEVLAFVYRLERHCASSAQGRA